MEELLKFAQLSLEAHVREYDGPALASELEGLLEEHVLLLHQVGDDDAGAPRDTSIAVDKHATLLHALLDERNSCWEVPYQARLTSVSHRYHLVLKVLGKEGFDPGGDLEDVSYAG